MTEEKWKLIGKALRKAGELIDDEPSEQSLLKEYEVCQQEHNSNASTYWTMTSIFIGFTSALLGGLIYGIISNNKLLKVILEPSPESKELLFLGIIAWVLSMAVIIVLFSLRGWRRRIDFLSYLIHRRMHEIEIKLGMRKGLIIQSMDNFSEFKKADCDLNLKKYLTNFYTKYECEINKRYALPSEEWHHPLINWALIFLWTMVLLFGLYLIWFYCLILTFILLIITIAFLLGIWLRQKCLEKKKRKTRSHHLDHQTI